VASAQGRAPSPDLLVQCSACQVELLPEAHSPPDLLVREVHGTDHKNARLDDSDDRIQDIARCSPISQRFSQL
jgi:hypothetical protein